MNGVAYSEETLSVMIDAARQYIEIPELRDSIIAKCYREIGLLMTGTPDCHRAEIHLTQPEVMVLAVATHRWQLQDERTRDKSTLDMFHQGDGELSFDLAIARYKQGKCPGCGKGVGEPRGLEHRKRFADLYCHTCKRPWPVEMGATDLYHEVALAVSHEGNVSVSPAFCPSLPEMANSERTRAALVDRLSDFSKRVVLGLWVVFWNNRKG